MVVFNLYAVYLKSLILKMRKRRPTEKCPALCYTVSWGQDSIWS